MDNSRRLPPLTTPVLIALLVLVPFLVPAWLLGSAVREHARQYETATGVLDAFASGLQTVHALGEMRDLTAAYLFIGSADLGTAHEQARQTSGAALGEFTRAVQALGSPLLGEHVARLEENWKTLALRASDDSSSIRPFENAGAFLSDVYDMLSMLVYVSDLSGAAVSRNNEILLLEIDTLRKLRHAIGLMRSVIVYSAARDGYLNSADAELLDNAWNDLDTVLETLTAQLHGVVSRNNDPRWRDMVVTDLPELRRYLDEAEESVLYATRIEGDWRAHFARAEPALDDADRVSLSLLAMARAQAADARAAQQRGDLWLAIGLLALYLAIAAIAIALYSSRYQALRAQADNEAKGQFLARMSHEIRTPLNGVIGLAELLRDTEPTPRQQQYINLIESAGRSLASLVNDILDYAKIEAGKFELDHTDFDLHALIEECTHMFSLRASDNRDLVFSLVDDSVPRILNGDPVRLRQVLINLVSNAVKFTENGRVEVRVQRRDGTADESARLRFEVADTGIGMSAGEQEHLFDSFVQASAAVARRFGGTGLGLSISREIVRLMQGEIGVSSSPGMGSTFWFELPLPPGSSAGAGVARDGGRPVLVLDLDGNVARFLRNHAGRWPQVEATTTPAQAGAALAAHPAITGLVVIAQHDLAPALAAIEQLRGRTTHLPVTLVTGVRTSVDAERCAALGVGLTVNRNTWSDAELDRLFAGRDPDRNRQAPSTTARATALPVGMRVLVAEDNPVNQLVTQGLLARLGIQAELVENGQLAVEHYRAAQGRFDIILMDLDMPVLDGTAAARQIRRLQALEGWPDCAIVALSAHALREYGDIARNAGMDGQLVKPVTLATLQQALLQYYRPPGRPRQSSA
jgi:signal transduction histidine kinase/CheY-like chemotaxis protein